MIKEGRIMGERRVFTKEFKERAVELARNTKRKRSCPRPRHKSGYAGTMDAGDEAE
jgi:transposase-like protein